MKSFYDNIPNGYLESIRKGSAGVRRFGGGAYYGSGDRTADIVRLSIEIEAADPGLRIIQLFSRLGEAAGIDCCYKCLIFLNAGIHDDSS